MDSPLAVAAFTPYGPAHWMMLTLTVAGVVVLVRLGRRHRGTPTGVAFARIFGFVQLVVSLGFLVLWLVPALFDMRQSLPLHLSDLLRLVSGYALLSRRRWAVTLTYYWGLTLNPQALLTPDLTLDVAPALEFASYWVQHVLVMWAVCYLTWGLGLHPNWRDYRLALVVTVGWAAVTLTINRALGTNYGYVSHKPAGGSLLDLLGDWPWYLLVVFVLLAGVWALITWPWVRRSPAAS